MKRTFFLLAMLTFFVGIASAQQPILYQAVLRDDRGYIEPDKKLELTLRLLSGGSEILYSETHSIQSDALGQIQVPFGKGIPVKGSAFASIDWSQPDLVLQVLDGKKEMAILPITAVPSALHAQSANTASSIQGLRFDDEAEPSHTNYYSSDKVAKLIQGQTGQTGLAKETAERKAEDLRILDSLKAEADRRIQADLALLDSIAAVAAANKTDYGYLLDSIALERASRILADRDLLDSIRTLAFRIGEVDLEREREDLRIWDSIGSIKTNLALTESTFSDSLAVERTARIKEDLRIWDSIEELDRTLTTKEQNVCKASDPARGIYTEAIPLYDPNNPDTIGLFAMPELKVLRQSGTCDLFSSLDLAENLDRSYKTRIMTYNTTGSLSTPQIVTIPAGESGVDVFVDNYLIDTPVQYKTYDILVFDVEYFHIGEGQGKLYVTLVRE